MFYNGFRFRINCGLIIKIKLLVVFDLFFGYERWKRLKSFIYILILKILMLYIISIIKWKESKLGSLKCGKIFFVLI